MKNILSYAGRIIGYQRLPQTANGNPRYLVELLTDDGDYLRFRTKPDSSLAYCIVNAEYRDNRVLVKVGEYYGYNTLVDIEVMEDLVVRLQEEA